MSILKIDENQRNSSAVTTFSNGRNPNIGTTATQITSESLSGMNGISLKAGNANLGIIYIGNIGVTANTVDSTDGFELSAGQSVTINVDNVNKIYAIASQASQVVYFIVS